MTREEVFSKLNKEAEVLLKNNFILIKDYSDEKLSTKVYKKRVNLKCFAFYIVCHDTFASVISEVRTSQSAWENKIRFQLDRYKDVEDDIKELISSTIELSTL